MHVSPSLLLVGLAASSATAFTCVSGTVPSCCVTITKSFSAADGLAIAQSCGTPSAGSVGNWVCAAGTVSFCTIYPLQALEILIGTPPSFFGYTLPAGAA